MDYEEIKKLIKEVENSKLESISMELPDGTKINMKKEQTEYKQNTEKSEESKKLISAPEDESLKTIKSPMVGTFYSKASPSSKPFVQVGDKVKKGDVLCIIEAMKLMNEIESDVDGEIVEICCKEEALVEYGTVLFKIK